MIHKLLALCFGIVALVWATSARADSHQGKVVETGAGKLTMTDMAGQNKHTMDVPADATITRDGKTAALTDLKAGDTITVTTERKGDKPMVTKVEAKPAGS
jgi:Cu/Ag efflux protein CusF